MEKKALSGPLLILGVVQLVESLAFALPIAFFPNYAMSLGASVASIGLFTSSFMIAFAVLSPVMGNYTDRYGRKRLLVAGILTDVVLGTATGLVPSWEWLLLIRVLNGAVSSAAMLASETLLIDLIDPSTRGEVSGFIMSMSMIGRNIGPFVGGGIQWLVFSRGFSEIMSYRVPYFVDSLVALLALIIVVFKIEEPERRNPSMRGMRGGKDVKLEFTTPLKVMLINSFIIGVGVGFIIPIMVLFYTDRFGMDPIGIGTLVSISGFIGLLASYVAGRYSDKIGRKPLIALGNYSSALMGGLLPFTGNITQAGIITTARSLGFNVSMPAFRALRADLVPAEVRGRMFGLFGTAFTAGSVAGPIIGTWLYSTYRFAEFNVLGLNVPGIGFPFYINAILGLMSTSMMMLWIKEPTEEDRAAQFAGPPMD